MMFPIIFCIQSVYHTKAVKSYNKPNATISVCIPAIFNTYFPVCLRRDELVHHFHT